MAKKQPRYFDFVGSLKIYIIISASLLAIAFICSLIFGVEIDIQFRGGTMATYSYSGEIAEDDFHDIIVDVTGIDAKVTGSQNVQTGEPNFNVEFSGSEGFAVEDQNALLEALQKEFPGSNIQSVSVNSVSPTMGKDFLLKSLVAVFFSALFMVIYIAFRFKKIGGWSAGVFAVIALLHDVLMVFAAFVVFRMPLDDNFMAVVLVILGYSVNDTIVIYDRIRENQKLYGEVKTLPQIVNDSTNETLTRTIHTSVSTLASMVIVCIMGLIYQVDSIVTFALPMIAGLISGSYSSICLCVSGWTAWKMRGTKGKKTKKAARA